MMENVLVIVSFSSDEHMWEESAEMFAELE